MEESGSRVTVDFFPPIVFQLRCISGFVRDLPESGNVGRICQIIWRDR